MAHAYSALHQAGHAHSVEVWQDDQLVGGLYGVAMGRIFFGESMFSRERDASKVALVYLSELLNAWQFQLIDCQVYTGHLVRLGAEEIPRSQLGEILQRFVAETPAETAWSPALATPRPITYSAESGFCHD
jgi:leucyl/phenylalanyl-tRNA--protein transferase